MLQPLCGAEIQIKISAGVELRGDLGKARLRRRNNGGVGGGGGRSFLFAAAEITPDQTGEQEQRGRTEAEGIFSHDKRRINFFGAGVAQAKQFPKKGKAKTN